ncbi:MAG: nucleotide exchange factor GrpE [Candidatus Brocadiae bacterium]|nr:nucleotide exchange factor GrpE [Candidatus Brocadiia bacterium]
MNGEEDSLNESAPDAEEPCGREPGSQQTEAAATAEPMTLSRAEYEELRTLARERDDYLKRLQRAVADYQNLQKRIDKFRQSDREATLRSLAEEILPMADSLAWALEAARQAEGAENIVEGLRLVEKEFYGAFEKFGIRPVEATGQKFDPHYHEAAMQEQVDGAPPNTVIRELKKGFVMGDVIIRPSQVVVSGSAQAGPQPAQPRGEQTASGEDPSC